MVLSWDLGLRGLFVSTEVDEYRQPKQNLNHLYPEAEQDSNISLCSVGAVLETSVVG